MAVLNKFNIVQRISATFPQMKKRNYDFFEDVASFENKIKLVYYMTVDI